MFKSNNEPENFKSYVEGLGGEEVLPPNVIEELPDIFKPPAWQEEEEKNQVDPA